VTVASDHIYRCGRIRAIEAFVKQSFAVNHVEHSSPPSHVAAAAHPIVQTTGDGVVRADAFLASLLQ
jgi:hypothetical protein